MVDDNAQKAPLAPTVANMPTPPASAAVRAANSLPQLVANLETVDPGLAKQIQGSSALASKTLWGHLIIVLISAAAAKYGVNWDNSFDAELATGLMMGAQALWGVIARLITKSPITGVVTPAPVKS